MRLCVFAGSSRGNRPRYPAAARALGTLCASRGIGIVYGGGHVGLMGVVADAALAAGGEVIGVIPERLVELELAHAGLTRLHVTSSMHERKAQMADLSDAFVALPGGIGTLEELFETWTWAQLGYHSKPCGLLDVDGYYQPLIAMVDQMVEQEFLAGQDRRLLLVEDDPERMLALLADRCVGAPERPLPRSAL